MPKRVTLCKLSQLTVLQPSILGHTRYEQFPLFRTSNCKYYQLP